MIYKQLDALLAPALTHLGYEYWGMEQRLEGRRCIYCVYIDKPGGVNLDDCAKASVDLSALLEAESDLSEAYVLEVSSPGIERPLFNLLQYQRFIGERVSIKLHEKMDSRRLWQGILTAVTDKEVVITIDETEYPIPFINIARGHLVAAELK
jgi:ribosome maturation factor RimP